MPDILTPKRVTFGSDVEFFVARAATKEIVSAEGYIPGTKKNPAHFGSAGFATQLDNVLAEGNIPPSDDPWTLSIYMGTLRNQLNGLLRPHDLVTVGQAAARIPEEFLQTENAKTFGCDPSYNCWTLKEEKVTPTDPMLRSAGFHVHIGYIEPREEINIAIVRFMDACLGLTSVLYEPKSERRTVGYGKSGNFRHQPHGVEYRTLSSWFADNANRVMWVFNNTQYILRAGFGLGDASTMRNLKLVSAMSDEIQEAINTDDKTLARSLVNNLGFFNINHYGVVK